MDDVARRTSTTTAALPANAPGGIISGVRYTRTSLGISTLGPVNPATTRYDSDHFRFSEGLIVMLLRVIGLVLALTLAPAATAQSLPASFNAEDVSKAIEVKVRDKGFVGLSVVVVRNGETVLSRGFGATAISDGNPVSPDTPFAIGSITKQFVAACLFLLAEEGKLSLTDPVSKYFPELTQAREITLLDCLNHVSGYPDYYPLDFLDRRMRAPIVLDDLLKKYAGGPLDFAPGSRFSYSNTGYILAGRVVEKVSGESFGTFAARRIFRPLEMTQARVDPKPDTPGLARGHTSVMLGPTELAVPEANGWLHAAGGIYCSANDLAKWDLALMAGSLLKPDSWQKMTSPRTLTNGKISDYAGGLGIARVGGEIVYQHSGAVSGFHAYNAIVPRLKSAVVVLSNAEHVDAAGVHREILQSVLRDLAKREEAIPKIDGPPVKEVVLATLRDLRDGKLDRTQFGEEFNHFFTDARVETTRKALDRFGAIEKVDLENSGERGGMEASRLRVTCQSGIVKVNIFRSRDGKIQQFLLTE